MQGLVAAVDVVPGATIVKDEDGNVGQEGQVNEVVDRIGHKPEVQETVDEHLSKCEKRGNRGYVKSGADRDESPHSGGGLKSFTQHSETSHLSEKQHQEERRLDPKAQQHGRDVVGIHYIRLAVRGYVLRGDELVSNQNQTLKKAQTLALPFNE